ncbi:MAG: phosphotransferase [Erysipelotrichaceae bacterium]|nr:phosphotransferase [Erysipelotrichaceae bacterium]
MEKLLQKYQTIDCQKLDKGWSRDCKYVLTDIHQKKYVLRISDGSSYEKRKVQYEYLRKLETLDINCTKLLEFGMLSHSQVYMLFTWLEGKSAEEVIPTLPNQQAYELGVEAGKTLQLIHQIEVKQPENRWFQKYQEKIARKIQKIEECKCILPEKERIIHVIQTQMGLVKNQTYTFCHGDYHVGNMVIHEGRIGIIDFDKCSIADPYDEFKPFCWNVFVSEWFETGLIHGYFDGQIPDDFFPILALYAAESLISHLPWAITFGEKEVQTAYRVIENVLKWYDDFRLVIPTWYREIPNEWKKNENVKI